MSLRVVNRLRVRNTCSAGCRLCTLNAEFARAPLKQALRRNISAILNEQAKRDTFAAQTYDNPARYLPYSRRSQEGVVNMKNQFPSQTLIILAVVLALAAPSLAQWGAGRGQRFNSQGMCLAQIDSIPKQALDPTETAGLAYMREEEKLAHDVYARLYAKWGLRILGNISQSEDRHLNAIKLLLDRYELPDPAANSPAGVFQNEGLQTLYGDLVRQGESSLKSAVRVGATIEDLDIRDLEKAAAATDNSDLKLVYQNLRQASENHMRSLLLRQLSLR
jgi:hypothetical protein